MPTVTANTDPRDRRDPLESRSPSELADFLDHAPVPIHSVDAAGTILWANRAALALLGYRADEYVGHPIAAFHLDPGAYARMCARLADGETLHDYEAELRCKDGTIRRVSISANLQVLAGRVTATRCFLRDITVPRPTERERVVADLGETFDAGMSGKRSDRIPLAGMVETASAAISGTGVLDVTALRSQLIHEVHQNEARFRLLVESIKDYAIFMLDANGKVATWNAGAQRIKGYAAHEIIGQHFSAFYSDEENRAGKTAYELRAALRDGRHEDEGWRIRKDGTRFWANVVITTLRDASGMLLGYAKITRDLTERRKLEDERLQLARAQEALRLRDEFLSLASHELKTPLTVLQLQLEALRERVDAGDRATIAKLDRSDRACRRLGELIEALLDVSRIATGQFALHLEQADVADVVATAVDQLHETAELAGCPLTVTVEHVVGLWDRSRVDQVVSNLIANALRYAAGTAIQVAVTREPGGVAIEVRDHGPGLPEGQLARIFERFERGASMRHFGGLGLGLYVVRQITEAHGGHVTAHNAADGGACLTVHLPAAGPAKDLVA